MRLSRTNGVGAGLLVLVLGVWAGIVPFIGPYFNYGFTPNATWHFTLDRLWLSILPGAAAALGALTMITAARRSSGVLGGWIALLGGVWLLIGPSVSLLWGHAPPGTLQSGIGAPLGGHDRAAIEMIGFFYGTGALVTMLSAFAIGRFSLAPPLAVGPGTQARGVGGRDEPQAPVAAGSEQRGGARRGLIGRRRRGSEPPNERRDVGERDPGARPL
jgi:hypothetical protein